MEEIFDINEGKALIFEDDEGRLTLSPRGCFASALLDTGIGGHENAVELSNDPKFDCAFKVLVFTKTVSVYFKNANEDELEAAFDEFAILMEEHNNTKE